jgi:2-oxoglutarate dehydrogenase E1 component
MERYLQLCAKDNMFVADCTTPANLFHLLRRQMKVNYRKPLIIFTPKSLLRHPKVVSTKEEFVNGSFQMIIDDATAEIKKIKILVFVTGKFYYDLLEKKEELKRKDVALIRVEQLFPLPVKELKSIIKKYKNVDDLVWAQEEPKNMGCWSFVQPRFATSTRQLLDNEMHATYAGRAPAASPATGYGKVHDKEQNELIDAALSPTTK